MSQSVSCQHCKEAGLYFVQSRKTGNWYLVYPKDDGTPHGGLLHKCGRSCPKGTKACPGCAVGTANGRPAAILSAAQYAADRAAAKVSAVAASQTVPDGATVTVSPSGQAEVKKAAKGKAKAAPVSVAQTATDKIADQIIAAGGSVLPFSTQSVPVGSAAGPIEAAVIRRQSLEACGFPTGAAEMLAANLTDQQVAAMIAAKFAG